MHKKVLNLKPKEKIPFNVERTSKMENLKKTYQKLKNTIVIHIIHVGKEIIISKIISYSIKKKQL